VTEETRAGLSIATLIWQLSMMCIFSKERTTLCEQVEETRGEIFAASLIALESQCKNVPNEPIPTYGHSWLQHHSVHSKYKTNRARRNCETALRGRCATQQMALKPGTTYCATGVSLMALPEHVLSDGAIPPVWKSFSADAFEI